MCHWSTEGGTTSFTDRDIWKRQKEKSELILLSAVVINYSPTVISRRVNLCLSNSLSAAAEWREAVETLAVCLRQCYTAWRTLRNLAHLHFSPYIGRKMLFSVGKPQEGATAAAVLLAKNSKPLITAWGSQTGVLTSECTAGIYSICFT